MLICALGLAILLLLGIIELANSRVQCERQTRPNTPWLCPNASISSWLQWHVALC